MSAFPVEIFDIVDPQDQVIGQATRHEAHAGRLLHRAVHILIFNPAGALLVQKRAMTKDTFPGCYDSSASGHLNAGESYDAAAYREVQEELGLVLPVTSLQKQFKLDACPDTGWEFVWIYTVLRNTLPVVPNPDEIESVTHMTRRQIESLLADQPHSCARSFRRVLREVFARELFPFESP